MTHSPGSNLISTLLLLLCLNTVCSCQNKKNFPVERAFYYWKSNGYQLQDKERKALYATQAHKLYVKYFEIKKDPVMGDIPEAKTDFHIYQQRQDANFDKDSTENIRIVVPVVYIGNECFKNTTDRDLDALAANIVYLVDKYHTQLQNGINYQELQIDCDWTESTKKDYFALLKKLKAKSDKTISCTLRLYPYKYRKNMGIPPVDRAMLMCYNLIPTLSAGDKKSVFDIKELKEYLGRKSSYPLPLDIALPIYSMGLIYHNNEFVKVKYGDLNEISNKLSVQTEKSLWYDVNEETYWDGDYLRPGDKIKMERIDYSELLETIDLLQNRSVLTSGATLALFHLDEETLKPISYATLDSLFAHSTH